MSRREARERREQAPRTTRRELWATGVLVLALAAIASGAWLVSRSGPFGPADASSTALTTSTTSSASAVSSALTARSNETSAPTRIDLMRGGKQILGAGIEPVDAPGGVLNPPTGVVGWYAAPGWPVPGTQSRQHSILAGHVTWKGRPDVFARLGEARIGDLVLVTDSAGTVRRFVVVRGPVAIPKQQIAAAANAWVWSSDRQSNTLSLITCDPDSGVRTDGHLTGNIVVQARPG